jgi:hypothetical protein
MELAAFFFRTLQHPVVAARAEQDDEKFDSHFLDR